MGYTDEELVPAAGGGGRTRPTRSSRATSTWTRWSKRPRPEYAWAGGTPVEFSVIGICDGIAMGHAGMHYSLASREVIAASIEMEVLAHCFDAMVLVPNCDKIIPGMLMAAARINLPSICVSGGPDAGGAPPRQDVDFITVMEAQGAVRSGAHVRGGAEGTRGRRLPGLRQLRRAVHRQLHELPDRGGRHGPAGQRDHTRRLRRPHAPGQAGGDAGDAPHRERACARGTSSTRPPWPTPWPWTWPSAAPPTPSCTCWPSPDEAGVELSLEQIQEVCDSTPNLVRISPAGGSVHHMQDLHEAGGIPAVMAELSKQGLIDRGRSLRGRRSSMGEIFDGAGGRSTPRSSGPSDDPYMATGGLAILTGQPGPRGSHRQAVGGPREPAAHSGEGPRLRARRRTRSKPCAREASGPVTWWSSATRGRAGGRACARCSTPPPPWPAWACPKRSLLVTDGRFSGGTRGAAIGHVSPEAASGGPIALVREGDIIDDRHPRADASS